MGHARAHAERLIDAPPSAVYSVLADYRKHHAEIMPASRFSDLHVENGGVGAGTVFHITLRILGIRQRLHMQVAEPEPGQVLTETNLDTGVVTEFRIASRGAEFHTLVRISSDWETERTLRGLIDQAVTPWLLRRIFAQQLRQLADYLRAGAIRERQPDDIS